MTTDIIKTGMQKFVVIIFLGLLIGKVSYSQIVNIETARMQSDTTGWMGNINGSFSLTRNTSSVLQLMTGAHVQYKTKKNLYLLLGNYTLLKGKEARLVDNGFFHFRYNRKLSSRLRWEAFTQLQNNIVTKIQVRWLLGTGPRVKLIENEQLKWYAASLLMYETEEIKSDPVVTHKDFRKSSYISLTWKISDRVEVISTTFYQPLLNEWSDYRILNEEQFKVSITNKLALTVNWNYLYDSAPAEGIPETNYLLSTGVSYDL